MDVFLLIGIPFAVFLVADVWIGYAIGGHAAGPDTAPLPRTTPKTRATPAAMVLTGAVLTLFGAAAAATAGAFARLTNAGYAIEPAALLFLLEAAVDLALAALVLLPGWSIRRAWILRAMSVYWLCAAAPTMILADGGAGWLSTNPGYGMTLLAVPSFSWEAIAVLMPALLIWRASRKNVATDPPA
jgi:hypothetical protein